MERVQFDVSGQIFSVNRDVLNSGPSSRLTRMCTADGSQKDYFVVDRPADVFGAVLSMYQTGDLHIPTTSCPGAFLKEMEYWEIHPEMLTSCCFYRLQCFLDEQESLRKFRKSLCSSFDKGSKLSLASCTRLEKLRAKIWAIVDYRERTICSRIYFTVAFIMVLLSIFTLAYSTEPDFQRAMTNCERLEYMKASDMSDFDLVSGLLGRHCDDLKIPQVSKNNENNPDITFLNSPDIKDADTDKDYAYVHVYIGNNDNVDVNTTSNLRSGIPIYRSSPQKRVKIPNRKVRVYALVVLETITLVFFTIDFILRLLSCPCILRYFLSIINATDAAALIGTYLHMLMLYLYKHERYKDDWVDILEYLQMLRSLRLFRIVKNVRASRVLVYSIAKNKKDLSILMLFLIVGACTFASIVYICEKKNTIESIPIGWYWAIVTMTTVGYGDYSPQTSFGRFFGCMCAISGVLLFALTVPIFANNFVALYQYAGLENALPSRVNDVNTDPKQRRNERSGIKFVHQHTDRKKKVKKNQGENILSEQPIEEIT